MMFWGIVLVFKEISSRYLAKFSLSFK